MIREYNSSDINTIEQICSKLHNNFKLSLNSFSKCLLYEINNKIVGVIVYSVIYDRAELIDIIISTIIYFSAIALLIQSFFKKVAPKKKDGGAK